MFRRIYENFVPCTVVLLVCLAYAEVLYTLSLGSI